MNDLHPKNKLKLLKKSISIIKNYTDESKDNDIIIYINKNISFYKEIDYIITCMDITDNIVYFNQKKDQNYIPITFYIEKNNFNQLYLILLALKSVKIGKHSIFKFGYEGIKEPYLKIGYFKNFDKLNFKFSEALFLNELINLPDYESFISFVNTKEINPF